MMFETKYNIGAMLYLKTDNEQLPRLLTAVSFRPTGITYCLACGTEESWHYEFEISEEKNVLIEA